MLMEGMCPLVAVSAQGTSGLNPPTKRPNEELRQNTQQGLSKLKGWNRDTSDHHGLAVIGCFETSLAPYLNRSPSPHENIT